MCFFSRASSGTLFRASQFLAEELPIRLAHRVQELQTLPDGLNEMPSVQKVADWYAQSFEVCFLLSLCLAMVFGAPGGRTFMTHLSRLRCV